MILAPSVEEVSSFEALRRHLPDAGDLSNRDLFTSLPWFDLLDRHGSSPGSRKRILLVRGASGRPVMALPLVASGGLESFSNFYSGLFGPIMAEPEPDAEFTVAVCSYLRAGRVPYVRLAPLDADAPFTRRMQTSLEDVGFWTDTYFCFGNWHLPVEGMSFDAYATRLPGHLRSTLTRRAKRLSGAGKWRVTIHQEPGAGLESAIADFESVYRLSWKSAEPYPRFVPELCRMTASAGCLRLGVLSLEDKPLAAQVWLRTQDRAMIFKLAYDPAFAQYSAGTLLTASLMRHAIDVDRVREVDYLSGDDAYKRDWMPCRRERIGIVAFNPGSARGLLGAARHFAGRAARRLRSGGHLLRPSRS